MSTSDPGKDIREQAARWVIRMTDPDALSDTERDEFAVWIADPLHAMEFHAIHTVTVMTGDLPQAERARLSEEARIHSHERVHSRRQFLRWSAVAASLIAVLVLGGYFAQADHWFGESAYVTRTGETRAITFEEGSTAYLNTRTELRWIGSKEDRRVMLAAGEALFDIKHDKAHPFRVVLDNSEIRVLGTRFNVYRKPSGDTTVTVLDGTVEVRGFSNGSAQSEWVRTLQANEQIEYGSIGLVREPHETQAQEATRWRDGVYQFDNQPVVDVLNELTRYTDQHIYIRDPRIAAIRASGSLPIDDVRRALRRLKDAAPVDVKESNGTFTISYREAGRKD